MLAVAKTELANYNFSLPEIIAAEFRAIGDVAGERNKVRWAVAAAAVLKLLEMPEEEMHKLIREVAGARLYPDVLKQMVERAKAARQEDNESKGFRLPRAARKSDPPK